MCVCVCLVLGTFRDKSVVAFEGERFRMHFRVSDVNDVLMLHSEALSCSWKNRGRRDPLPMRSTLIALLFHMYNGGRETHIYIYVYIRYSIRADAIAVKQLKLKNFGKNNNNIYIYVCCK